MLLMERGLMVDAALAARNGIETLLLLDLLSKKPELCQKWVNGEKFKPVDVRKQLQGLLHVTVGDLVIKTSKETYDEVSFLYAWLSRIAHANLESLNQVTTQTGANAYEIQVGGSHSQPVILAITQSISTLAPSAFKQLRPVWRYTNQRRFRQAPPNSKKSNLPFAP
jgi:hypothetical protein